MIGDSDRQGTTVTFKADATIFKETTTYDYETIRDRIRQLAFLNKGLKLILIDERLEPARSHEYHYEGGLKEYIQFLNQKMCIRDSILIALPAIKVPSEFRLAVHPTNMNAMSTSANKCLVLRLFNPIRILLFLN